MTPVNVNNLEYLLKQTNYDPTKTQFLIDGFTNGFDLGYRGPENIQQTSNNLKFSVGNEVELWNKVMKEVKEKRYAGPFKEIPFDNFIQSPIGLVPKQGNKTRLIFHLSYPRDTTKGHSVNHNTPKELTKVTYSDFDQAVKLCILEGPGCYMGKSDMTSAFRHLNIKKKHWKYLVMKAKSPIDRQWYYFVDKCMPFGASISCSHFQAFSDAISHIVKTMCGKENVNYLDDYFFVALKKIFCNGQLELFLKVCKEINFPVSMEKTFWADTRMEFLGLLIDTINQMICIPVNKVVKAKQLIYKILARTSKKMTKQELQSLTGFLNFLGKAVIPGRAFTRRLYSVLEGKAHLKKYHHLNVTAEVRMDIEMWLEFLEHPGIFARKFLDMDDKVKSEIYLFQLLDDSHTIFIFFDADDTPWLQCRRCFHRFHLNCITCFTPEEFLATGDFLCCR